MIRKASAMVASGTIGRFVFLICLTLSAAAGAQPPLSASPPSVLITDDSDAESLFGRELRTKGHSSMDDEEFRAGYALYPEFLDPGVSGPTDYAAARGYFVAGIGRDLAGELTRLLRGERSESISIQRGNYTEVELDARQLDRWGIAEHALPADTVIRFRESGPWERYRWQIVLLMGGFFAESGIIAALLYERRRRRSAEIESHQHLLEVTQMGRALTTNTMSSSIAHELNQPLTAIMGNAEAALMLIDADPVDREELKQIVEDIRRDDQRAADIIKHLRLLLRQSEIQSQNVNLSSVLKDALSLIQSQADACATKIRAEISDESVHVRADSVHLQQVVLNLVVNAMEAMRSQPEHERSLELRVDKTASEAVVSITDSGDGIPADKIDKIFNPFMTTKKEGTGLGLAIARTIINTYGGRIWVENNALRGATFRFSLRLAAA